MALTNEVDQYGNIWDDRGYWVGAGANAGQIYQNGEWTGASGGGLPWETGDSGGGGVTYTQNVDYDGSVTGVPGATYQKSSSGSVSIISRPPSGGGGTTVINQGGRYQTQVDPDGSVTGIPGSTYQVDTYDGSITVVSKPASNVNPADRNNDGLDDTTNLALGVFPSKTSPTGYMYGSGIPVWPNGAPYEGGGEDAGNEPPKLVNGKYIWDGTKFVVAPGLEGTGSSSGGGTYIKTSTTPKASSYSSGGGSSAPVRDYLGEQQAGDAAAMARLQAQLAAQAEQNALNRQQDWMQFQATQAANAADRRRQTINDFRAAMTDTDPSALYAWLYAQGVPQGGNIVNRLNEGGNALSPNALAGAAALLAELRGQAGTAYGLDSWMPQVPALATAVTPPAATVPTGTPTAPGTGTTPVPGLPATPQTPVYATSPDQGPPPPPQLPDGRANPAYGEWWMNYQQKKAYDEAKAEDAKRFNLANWVPEENLLGMPWWKNTVTGERLNPTDWLALKAAIEGKPPIEQDMPVTPAYGGAWELAVRPIIYDSMGQASGTSYQTIAPWAAGYHEPGAQNMPAGLGGPQVLPYGNDNRVNQVPAGQAGGPTNEPRVETGNLANNHIVRGIDTPNRVVVPGLARGGVAYGPMIVGDSPSGRRTGYEELVIAPHGAKVIPLNARRLRGLKRAAVPGYADGTDPWAWLYDANKQPEALLDQQRASQPYVGDGWTGADPTAMWVAQQHQSAPAYHPAPTQVYQAPVSSPVATPVTGASPQPATPAVSPAAPTGSPPSPVPVTSSPPPATYNPAPPTPIYPAPAPAPAPTPAPVPGLPQTGTAPSVTPEQQALMDEVQTARENVPVPTLGFSPYDVNWGAIAPGLRDAYIKGIAAQKGVRPDDFAWEISRNQGMMPGLSRGSVAVGY